MHALKYRIIILSNSFEDNQIQNNRKHEVTMKLIVEHSRIVESRSINNSGLIRYRSASWKKLDKNINSMVIFNQVDLKLLIRRFSARMNEHVNILFLYIHVQYQSRFVNLWSTYYGTPRIFRCDHAYKYRIG